MISMESMAQKYEELIPIYEKYKNIMNNSSEEDFKNKTFIENTNELYFHNFVNLTQNLTINELFDLSIPFEYSNQFNNKTLYSIDVKVTGIRLNKNKSINFIELEDRHPIESAKFDTNIKFRNKCFTFFNQMVNKWREYQLNVREISITIHQNNNWFPKTIYFKEFISFTIHSPNIMPHNLGYNNFREFTPGQWYDLYYNRHKTILLKPPFITNCMDYYMDGKQEYKLRSDCINLCINNEFSNKCLHLNTKYNELNNKSIDYIHTTYMLWRKEIFIGNNLTKLFIRNETMDTCFYENIDRIETECQLRCRPECVNHFYSYDIKTYNDITKYSDKTYNYSEDETYFYITHNQMPDQITEHIPEMTFISFAANFGGLLGMWLGLSALAIMTFVLNSYLD